MFSKIRSNRIFKIIICVAILYLEKMIEKKAVVKVKMFLKQHLGYLRVSNY